jgi:U6 snRNA-associated Sm-like protein LSm1
MWASFVLHLYLPIKNSMSKQNPQPFLPGASSLIEQLDTKVLVILRDGRHLLGTLRSLDQFSNLVLEDTYERHIAGTKYADIYLGLYIVRGDSLVMLGEVADDNTNSNMTEVEMSEIQELREKMPASEKVQWDF